MIVIKKINTTPIFSIISLMLFVIFTSSCNDMTGMSSYTLTLNDEDAVQAKGGYYYLEEEQNSNGKVEYPSLEYYQSVEWSESFYGTYLLHQNVFVNMNGSSITQKTVQVDVSCTGRLHPCSYADSVVKSVNDKKSGSSEVKFIRSKSDDLKKADDEEGSYNKASFLFMFVNSSKSISGSYDYEFSSPVPFLLRSDLTPASYKNNLAKDLTINYTYTSNNPYDPSGSVQLIVHLESYSSSTIKIKVSNILNNYTESTSAKYNENKQAERYGSFPFPKEVIYNIDVNKGKRITRYDAKTEVLITKNPKGSVSAYSEGNKSDPTTVETRLCKYTLSGISKAYSCGK